MTPLRPEHGGEGVHEERLGPSPPTTQGSSPARRRSVMRTYVRMTPRLYRPLAELHGALERGELSFAIMLAEEVSEERRRPIDLALALRFLPLVAAQQSEQYDAWALRWLVRWAGETTPSIEQAAAVAAALTDLPAEPSAWETLRGSIRAGV
jgi:hypothetical protein